MSLRRLISHRIFSGIQPTGIPHLGNYFGAIKQWITFAKDREATLNDGGRVKIDTPIYSIADVHSYTGQNIVFGQHLYDNILSTTAVLLALGLNTDNCILFKQSDVRDHLALGLLLNAYVTSNRLHHMTQFKDKSKSIGKGHLSNLLMIYPVLQAADILIYDADLVPVGEDQLQHLELARDIVRKFNHDTQSHLFSEPQALLASSVHSRRIRSLRDPSKKMSKSDPDKRAFIEITDSADSVREKCKKSLTDCISAVYYDAQNRPAVSNLMTLYHLATGLSFEEITDQFSGIETAEFKLKLADVLIHEFSDVRSEYPRLMKDPAYLEQQLEVGCLKVKPMASEKFDQINRLLGSQRPE